MRRVWYTAAMPRENASHTTRRRVPRWAWLAVLCVVLGLMTSVGVAWGLMFNAATAPPKPQTRMPVQGPTAAVYSDGDFNLGLRWSLRRSAWFGVDSNDLSLDIDGGCLVIIGDDELFPKLTSDPATQQAIARHGPLLVTEQGSGLEFSVLFTGWPRRCLTGENAYSVNDHAAYRTSLATILKGSPQLGSLITRRLDEPADRFNLEPCYNGIVFMGVLLPLRPLWSGLLANTAIYGGAWAVLIGGPILLRRWLRARRGGCPQCGYSREGLKKGTPCPECGRGA